MCAESSRAVVIFSVDIVGDRAPDGDEASAGSDRKKPTFREEHFNDVRQADAALAAEYAGGFIESQEAVEAPAIYKFTSSIEARVAVTASQAMGKQGSGCCGLKNVCYLIVPCRPVDV
jgi:hypothetical protein